MLNIMDYSQVVARARDELTTRTGDVFTSMRATRDDGFQWFTVNREEAVNRQVQLYFRLNDLYIRGFRVANLGYRFRGADQPMISGGGYLGELPYGDSYRDMGWKRNTPLLITMNNLNSALMDLQKSTRTKGPPAESMLRVVVAFSEAVRFSDIVHNIYLEKPIDPRALDWSRRGRGDLMNVQVVKKNG
jgi:hypothetical protein